MLGFAFGSFSYELWQEQGWAPHKLGTVAGQQYLMGQARREKGFSSPLLYYLIAFQRKNNEEYALIW